MRARLAPSAAWLAGHPLIHPHPPLPRPQELSRRCETLIRLIEKENEDDEERVRQLGESACPGLPPRSKNMQSMRGPELTSACHVAASPCCAPHKHPSRLFETNLVHPVLSRWAAPRSAAPSPRAATARRPLVGCGCMGGLRGECKAAGAAGGRSGTCCCRCGMLLIMHRLGGGLSRNVPSRQADQLCIPSLWLSAAESGRGGKRKADSSGMPSAKRSKDVTA